MKSSVVKDIAPLKPIIAFCILCCFGVICLVIPLLPAIQGIFKVANSQSFSSSQISQAIFGGIVDEIKAHIGQSVHKQSGFDLQINQRNLRRFYKLVDRARAEDVLTQETKSWIPAKLYVRNAEENEIYKVSIRLRGDVSNHYNGVKISLRIRFKGGKLWRGRKDIGLIIPEDRKYFSDILLSKLLTHFSLPNNGADIISLRINGTKAGSFILLERYDKVSLETQNYATSSVFKLDERAFVVLDEGKKRATREYNYSQNIVYNPAMWALRTKNIGGSSAHSALLSRVFELLRKDEQLKDDTYQTLKHYLNVEAYSWQSAFNFLFSAHLDAPHNALIFYDVVSAQFRPLAADPDFLVTSLGDIDQGNSSLNFQFIHNHLVTNKQFLELRNEKLQILQNNKSRIFSILKEIFEDSKSHYIGDGLLPANMISSSIHLSKGMSGPLLHIIYNDFKNILEERFRSISRYLEQDYIKISIPKQDKVKYSHTLVAATILKKSDTRYKIKITHNKDSVLTLDTIHVTQKINEGRELKVRPPEVFQYSSAFSITKVDDSNLTWKSSTLGIELLPNNETILFVDFSGNAILSEVMFSVKDNQGKTISNRRIITKIADNSDNLSIPCNCADISGYFAEKSNISLTIKEKVITIQPGDYIVNETIVIPRGFRLVFSPNIRVRFAPNVWFVSYSPLTINGTLEEPVVFEPKKYEANWNGFLVFQTNQADHYHRNIIEHLILKGGKSGNYNGIDVTGALLFADSDVTIINSRFYNSGLDDSINVKRADAILKDNVIYSSTSDAIDVDWVTGTIQGNYVLKSGGDGIDVSGSKELVIKNNFIAFSSDKGLSIGENSSVKIKNNLIVRNLFGAVSKDLSKISMSNNILAGNRTGLAAYQKKDFFGGARIFTDHDYFVKNEAVTYSDEQSKINKIQAPTTDISISNDYPTSDISLMSILEWAGKQQLPDEFGLNIELWKELSVQN